MTEQITIYRSPLSIRIKINSDYTLREAPFVSLYKFLGQFIDYKKDHRTRRYVPVHYYFFYQKSTDSLYISWAYLNDLIVYINNSCKNPVTVIDMPLSDGLPVTFNILDQYPLRDQRQVDALDYLRNSCDTLKGVAAQTGVGKTYIATRFLSETGRRAIVCCQGIIDQWIDNSLLKFTDMKKEDIYVISGNKSLVQLFRDIDKIVFPKVIVASTQTLKRYVKKEEGYEHLPDPSEMCSIMNIGVRVIDEAHLNFHATLLIDLVISCKLTIPLTATFILNNHRIRQLYNRHYPSHIRHGENSYKKYVDIVAYLFSTGFNDIPSWSYNSAEGYSHVRYELYLLKMKYKLKQIYDDVYKKIIEQYYINVKKDNEKLLIFFATFKMCYHFKEILNRDFPDKRLFVYEKSIFDKEKDCEELDNAEIILSTPKTCGTATDIKNLRTVFCTVSINSAPANLQLLGRLRELSDSTPILVYTVHKSVPKQLDYHAERRLLYGNRGKSYTIIDNTPEPNFNV